MTVKRLDINQPKSFEFSNEDLALINDTIQNYPENRKQSAVVPSLYIAQKRAGGWLPEQAILKVAEMLDMPKIRVLEIASFYSMFNLTPTGHHFIQVCGTTPCWLRGSDQIKKACNDLVGKEGEVSEDSISWLEVECLGACVNAPAVQINEDYYEDLNYGNMTALIKKIKGKKDIKVGSQIGRASSEPKKMEKNNA